MHNDTATAESSLTVPCKLKLPYTTQQSHSQVFIQEVETYANIYSDFIQNCSNSEITHMSHHWQIHKRTAVHLHTGVLLLIRCSDCYGWISGHYSK